MTLEEKIENSKFACKVNIFIVILYPAVFISIAGYILFSIFAYDIKVDATHRLFFYSAFTSMISLEILMEVLSLTIAILIILKISYTNYENFKSFEKLITVLKFNAFCQLFFFYGMFGFVASPSFKNADYKFFLSLVEWEESFKCAGWLNIHQSVAIKRENRNILCSNDPENEEGVFFGTPRENVLLIESPSHAFYFYSQYLAANMHSDDRKIACEYLSKMKKIENSQANLDISCREIFENSFNIIPLGILIAFIGKFWCIFNIESYSKIIFRKYKKYKRLLPYLTAELAE